MGSPVGAPVALSGLWADPIDDLQESLRIEWFGDPAGGAPMPTTDYGSRRLRRGFPDMSAAAQIWLNACRPGATECETRHRSTGPTLTEAYCRVLTISPPTALPRRGRYPALELLPAVAGAGGDKTLAAGRRDRPVRLGDELRRQLGLDGFGPFCRHAVWQLGYHSGGRSEE
jgi:hypothetical protein